jgi:hypothetical protein
MFIGHFAMGFGAKRFAPAVSLGTLFAACQFADLLWPLLVIAGVERVAVSPGATAVTPLDFLYYPFSHSLVAGAIWGILAGAIYVLLRKGRPAAGAVIALLVVSHWGLDALSHRSDMPVAIWGATRVGLGLWNSLPATLLVEGGLFCAGVLLYARSTRPVDRTGIYAFRALVAFLIAVYAANLFGPPPPSGEAAAGAALAMWLLVAWGYWIDHHRLAEVRS